MKSVSVMAERRKLGPDTFAELVIWRVPSPLRGSTHPFKYRLAYIVAGECVLRYDNEAGKGDHKHVRGGEVSYSFTSVEALLGDFWADVGRSQRGDGDSHL